MMVMINNYVNYYLRMNSPNFMSDYVNIDFSHLRQEICL